MTWSNSRDPYIITQAAYQQLLQSLTKDFVPVSDRGWGIGNDNRVPDNFIVRVDEAASKMTWINVKKICWTRQYSQLDIQRRCLPAITTSVCRFQQQSACEKALYLPPGSRRVSAHCPVNPLVKLEKHIRPVFLTPVFAKVWSSSPAGGL